MEISEQIIQSIGWAMLHSIWQGLIIFIIIKILFFIGDEYISARSKSMLLMLGITSMVIWSVATYLSYLQSSDSSTLTFLATNDSSESSTITLSAAGAEATGFDWKSFQGTLEKITFYLPYLWIIGMFYYLSKTIMGMFWIKRLKSNSIIPDQELLDLGEKVKRKLNLKRLEIRISNSVSSPIVIGVIKNTVLFPVSWSMGLSPQQLESIIAHEAGHIMRKDGIINLYISFIESVLFFNPFFWLLKNALTVEQEKACDSIAVAYSGNRKDYAHTLLTVAQYNLTNNISLSSSFFKLNKNEFLHRIKYIMEGSMEKQTREKQGSVVLAMVLMIGMILFQINDLSENNVQNIPQTDNNIQASILTNGNIALTAKVSEVTDSKDKATTTIETKSKKNVSKVTFIEKPDPSSEPKPEPVVVKVKTLISPGSQKISLDNKLLIKLDTIPDPEKWEEFAEEMRKMEVEMAEVLEGHEEQLEEMNEIFERFNEEWADKLADLHEDMELDIDMDFERLAEISESFADIQLDLHDIQVDIDTEMLERLEEEMEVHEDRLREMSERFAEDEARWREDEERWREEESRWKEEENRYHKFEEDLKYQLVKDGFIGSKDDPLQFKYDDEEININGEKLDKDLEKKYRKLLEKHGMKGKGSIMWN